MSPSVRPVTRIPRTVFWVDVGAADEADEADRVDSLLSESDSVSVSVLATGIIPG